MPVTSIDGDNVLYHYFRDELIENDNRESKLLIGRMIHDLSVWLPPRLYQKVPVLLPFVIRDPTCRKSVNKKQEEWGSCDSNGYFRDDNTLVKAIPRSFKITSANKIYNRRKIAKGFVASHVWRKLVSKSALASRDPLTNTFVPNLVWLPRQLSKLTDRENSFAQGYLQALSAGIFRHVELPSGKMKFVTAIWEMLKMPKDIDKIVGEVASERLNFFTMSEEVIQNRVTDLVARMDVIKNRQGKLYCSRYLPTYEMLPEETKKTFESRLSGYAEILSQENWNMAR